MVPLLWAGLVHAARGATTEGGSDATRDGAASTEADRAWWSFCPLAKTHPPEVDDQGWSRGEIDRFIYQSLAERGCTPAPEADRSTLARRLYFDLWGLPPTPAQTTAFANDPRTDAYERLVDRLLADPRYGERFARPWLDLVRYAESDGFKADVYRPHAWRYRDYVIDALNADKPYDRFVQEQLAGDELYPDDRDARIATGYLRMWPLEDNQKDVRRQWELILNDVTEVTGEAFLGLGVGCARCHDHKYDPLPQRDYFRLQAFFAAMLPRDDLRIVPPAEYDRLRAWELATDSMRRALVHAQSTDVAARCQPAISVFPAYLQQIYALPVMRWSPLFQQYAYLAHPQILDRDADDKNGAKTPTRDTPPAPTELAVAELHKGLQECALSLPDDQHDVLCVTDVGCHAPPTFIGPYSEELSELQRPDPPVRPGFLSVLDPTDATIEPFPSLQSTGRRAALARWLTQTDHPLATRVIVNRLWQAHFGVGLVDTPNDFGRQGSLPTHPELLDWLARRFVADGWSLKRMHRRIVTSATYRQRSEPSDPATIERDPENRWLARYRLRRLESEQLRDAMLLVSDELDLRSGGPSEAGDVPRRSVYVRNMRNTPDELLHRFDGPDMFNSCAVRFATTTPLQSLLLWNSPWSRQRAAAFAHSVLNEEVELSSHRRLVERALWRAYGRAPTEGEATSAATLLASLAHESADVEPLTSGAPSGAPSAPVAIPPAARAAALVEFCHVLLCSNEFIYVD